MDIENLTAQAIQIAKKAKEDHVREAKGKGDTDAPTTVVAMREDDVVVVVRHPPERDVMLYTARVLAQGFNADVVTIVMETYQSEQYVNPVTGKEWGPREMAEVAKEHDGIAKGWVVESLMVWGCVRGAAVLSSAMLPYVVNGREVEWGEEHTNIDGGAWQFGGFVPEALAKAMTDQRAVDQMAADGVTPEVLGMSKAEFYANLDYHAAQMMSAAIQEEFEGMPYLVALAAKVGSPRQQHLKETHRRDKTRQATMISVIAPWLN